MELGDTDLVTLFELETNNYAHFRVRSGQFRTVTVMDTVSNHGHSLKLTWLLEMCLASVPHDLFWL